jgi:hypothetical protein
LFRNARFKDDSLVVCSEASGNISVDTTVVAGLGE